MVSPLQNKTEATATQQGTGHKQDIKGSRKNKFTFLALRFRLGLVDIEEQKAQ